MNRFKIAIGREADFENIWENRETYLDDVDGFQKFRQLRHYLLSEASIRPRTSPPKYAKAV